MRRKYVYFGKQIGLMFGLLSIGVALGFHLSLGLMQDAAIAQGALPMPGMTVTSSDYTQLPIWKASKTLQSAANGTAVLGGVLLFGYGVVDRYAEVIE